MFHFKQFSVKQDLSAMKIGTDSVLLGAWTPNNNPKHILDIGSGTGILSLMLAQRLQPIRIDAVEINGDAFLECQENFSQSKWSTLLNCYHTDIKYFAQNTQNKYDLIVCNPPFFPQNDLSKEDKRQTARQQTSLSFADLSQCVKTLVDNKGYFCVVIPYLSERDFILQMQEQGLFPQKITRVKGTENAPFKRSLIAFCCEKVSFEVGHLTIEHQRHQYTQEYIDLTKDFYLKF